MDSTQFHLNRLVREVRKQIRRRTMLQGGAVMLVVLFGYATGFLLLYPLIHGNAALFWGSLTGLLAVTGASVWWSILRPLRREVTDQQIAMYIEEQSPGLEDRLISAVEAQSKGVEDILESLLNDAARMAKGIVPASLVRKVRARIVAGLGTVLATALLVVCIMNMDRIRLVASSSLASVRPYITLSPGNAEVERGESQSVVAELRQGTDDSVQIVFKEGDSDQWRRLDMEPGTEGDAFMAEFTSIQETITYYVEAGNRKSEAFSITVYEFPAVDQIDLAYQFPDHLSLPPRLEDDSGDIRGLEGSTVTITVHTTGTPETAVLSLESGSTIPLRSREDGHFSGQIKLTEEDLYTVILTDENGKTNPFPSQYSILPVPDMAPHITVQDPGRDVRANAIEEVLVSADVDDDYGVQSFELVYYVGGGEEQTVSLHNSAGAQQMSGEHLLFLEDYSLQPGDVITYYIQARDALQEAVTDMYFIEIIPFDQSYTQVSAAAAQGGQQQQQSGLVVSQQELIAATWRLLRERNTHEDYPTALDAVAGAQENLKRSIEERISSTAFSLELRGNEIQQQTVRYLQEATEHMDEAVKFLRGDDLKDALAVQRKALTAILRADAQNRENQVAQQQQGQAGGGASATEERMSELMDLELDISKDKYEVQQQRSQQAEAMEDALKQVKDLARRQQDLADDLQRPDEMPEEDRKRFVDRLRRDQEDVREQLEDVARNMRQQQQQDSQGRMSRALRNMREADRALRRGNLDEAAQRQQQALRDLEALQPDLQRSARGTRREQLRALNDDLQSLTSQEQELAKDLEELVNSQRRPTEEEMVALDEQRLQIMDDLERAMQEAARMEAQSQDPEMTANLRNLQQQVQREDITGDMASSYRALRNGWLDSAQRLEEEILSDLENLEDARQALATSLPVTEEEALAAALREIQDLQEQLEGVESDAARLREGAADDDNRSLEARIQSQLSRAQSQLEELMDRNGGNNAAQGALSRVQNALSRADHTGVLLDEESAKSLFDQDIYDALNQLEADLLRALDMVQMENRLYGSRRGEVPPEYSDMVEKYYELLSRQ